MTARYHLRFPSAPSEGLGGSLPGARAVAVRIEPVRAVAGRSFAIDLTLRHAGGFAVVCGILLDRDSLALRDRSPYVLPASAAAAEAAIAAALDAVDPHVVAAFARESEPREQLIVPARADDGVMRERRSAHLPGAAPYDAVLRARGRAVSGDEYIETLFGEMLPAAPGAHAVTFGDPDATRRCYVALADAALRGGAALRTAHDLAEVLAADGYAVDLGGYDARSLEPYAAVHAVGLEEPGGARELIAAARARGVRALLTPAWDDSVEGGFWGANAHAMCLRVAADETRLGALRDMVRRRSIAFEDGIPPQTVWEPRPGYLADAGAALAAADAVCVDSSAQAQRLRARFGLNRAFVPAVPLARDGAVRSGGDAVVSWSAVEPLSASATLARASARAGMPLLLAGPVLDGGYAAHARSYLGERPVFVPAPAAARVAVDLSWSGVDYGALADAALCGIPLVVSARSYAREIFGEAGVLTVDPGDEDAVARALTQAWTMPDRDARSLDALAAHARARFRAEVVLACTRMAYAPQTTGVA